MVAITKENGIKKIKNMGKESDFEKMEASMKGIEKMTNAVVKVDL